MLDNIRYYLSENKIEFQENSHNYDNSHFNHRDYFTI